MQSIWRPIRNENMLASSRRLIVLVRRSSSSSATNSKRPHSSMPIDVAASSDIVGASGIHDVAAHPTARQLRIVFVRSALPMIGFGFMDQTVMLQAGNAIDCTLGVTFGLSTLTAAAFGQVCSDASGVLFGGALESLFKAAGLPASGLSAAQRQLPPVRRVKLAGSLLGVLLGCTLGLLNLLFIDTSRSSTLKLQAITEEQEFEYEVEASNMEKENATTLTVRGPDIDGVLASMTATLTAKGCSLVELHARQEISGLEESTIEDVFVVVKHDTKEKIPDDELDELAAALLEATRVPLNAHTFKEQVRELEEKNATLQQRVGRLERVVRDKQITVVPKSSS